MLLTRAIVASVICVIILPALFLLATPVILIGAAFSREGSYQENVKNGYGTVWYHWKRGTESII